MVNGREYCARTVVALGLLCTAFLVACSDGPAAIDRPPGVDRVELVPASAWISPGATLTLDGHALNTAGEPVGDVTLDWSSSDPSIATVTSSGAVQGVSAGETTVTVRAGSLRATSTITVVPAVRPSSFALERQGVSDVSLLGAWADASTDAPKWGGLNAFGESL